MPLKHKSISKHYTVGDLEDQIFAALKAAGKDLARMTADDLKPIDAFHIRGLAATKELAARAEIQKGAELLDVGCGLGGTSRYLASAYNCKVAGLDLTEEYCRVAETLSARVGLADRTSYKQGSALEIPFADNNFDMVWTEHVQMNIKNKQTFYKEIKRVLKPGGQLAFHDVFEGPAAAPPRLPVPWAMDDSINYLITVEDVRTLLAGLGFEKMCWEDKTEASAAFFRTAIKRFKTYERPSLGMHLLMGDDTEKKFANVLYNLENQRIRVVQAVFQKACRPAAISS